MPSKFPVSGSSQVPWMAYAASGTPLLTPDPSTPHNPCDLRCAFPDVSLQTVSPPSVDFHSEKHCLTERFRSSVKPLRRLLRPRLPCTLPGGSSRPRLSPLL
jgi:hypothetical protein